MMEPIDPIFVRSTHLLHSRAKDSAEQLRTLLVEVLKSRYGEGKSVDRLIISPVREINESASTSHDKDYSREKEYSRDKDFSRSSKEYSRDKEGGREAEKASSSSSSSRYRSKETEAPKILREVDIFKDADTDDNEDLALEIMEDVCCVVCNEISMGSSNQLVECLECHSLYHQECHVPPVARCELNDPRWAWYCSGCTQALNKQPARSSAQSSPKAQASSSSSSSSKHSKTESSNLFKRLDSKTSSKSHSSSSGSSAGLAGLAASFQPSQQASGSRSSTETQRGAAPKVVTTVISADKRLANMKKKAAKAQEKRKHIK